MIKLYSICSPSHKILRDKYFIPSIKDDFELIIEDVPQLVARENGEYHSSGWNRTMIDKVNIIIRAIKENPGRAFIHSDVDIQFFAPIEKLILHFLEKHDFVAQLNLIKGAVICNGFFAAIGNEKNLKLWEDIRSLLADKKNTDIDDQMLINKLIHLRTRVEKITPFSFLKLKAYSEISKLFNKENAYKIVWDCLPPIFFSPGLTLKGRRWDADTKMSVPKGIVMHHANWTVGIANKIAQLEYVKTLVRESTIYKK